MRLVEGGGKFPIDDGEDASGEFDSGFPRLEGGVLRSDFDRVFTRLHILFDDRRAAE